MAIWKQIPIQGVPDRFMACDEGLVMTKAYEIEVSKLGGKPFLKHMPERILKPRINKQSPSLRRHPVVGIYTGTSRENMTHREIRVARLVCAAFYGQPYDTNDQREVQRWRIRHRDGDLLNCSALNLEWVYNAGPAEVDGEKVQTTYEKNLDSWEEHKTRPASAVLSSLFGNDYEENAA